MRILLTFIFFFSCSSLYQLDPHNSEDTHATKKISFHQMGINFKGEEKNIGVKTADHLNELSQKIISTSQPVKIITIFANPENKDLTPKMELINFDRAENIKRYLEQDLHTQSAIVIEVNENSPLAYKKEADILILVEYL